ncbi:predicted protein [Naegleria gruberi]|uniref:Predicted protein n=1 Tax=Naegleria gruberi TaxID=5762 RepID=D2UXJ3_NAEGR|nr:uncharacterized protein NAEGRDRAFT_61145 [Naegleria gruberi]EFC50643.1 predicted protein [Naegleria gruberi]|eukprot:XP_002683387.1 predicted protein [Naegleria gruberi strain NEG-M]
MAIPIHCTSQHITPPRSSTILPFGDGISNNLDTPSNIVLGHHNRKIIIEQLAKSFKEVFIEHFREQHPSPPPPPQILLNRKKLRRTSILPNEKSLLLTSHPSLLSYFTSRPLIEHLVFILTFSMIILILFAASPTVQYSPEIDIITKKFPALYTVKNPWVRTDLNGTSYSKLYIPNYSYSLLASVGDYSVSLYPPDSPMIDVCSSDAPPRNYLTVSDLPFSVEHDTFDEESNLCIQFFCTSTGKYHEVENRKLNLTTWSQLDEFSWFYNYCYYCNNNNSKDFRFFLVNNTISDGDGYRDACPLFNSIVVQKAQQQCIEDSVNDNMKIGTFYLASDLMDISAFRNVLSFYDFMKFIQQSYFPYNCFCEGNSLSLVPGMKNFTFGYKCDVYSHFIIPFVFEFGPIFIFLCTILLLFTSIFLLQLPLCCAICKEARTKYYNRKYSYVTSLFDLRMQSNTILFISILWMSAQEVFAYLFNLYVFSNVYNQEDNTSKNGFMLLLGNGMMRMVSLVLLCCSFASMLVSWQHMTSTNDNFISGISASIAATGKALLGSSRTDQQENNDCPEDEEKSEQVEKSSLIKKEERPQESLTLGNKLILSGFYLSLLALLISVICMSFFITKLSIIFMVFIAFGMMYLWIFPIGFLFSGIRMYYKLKSMKENVSFARLKVIFIIFHYLNNLAAQFTRFMIFADICFLLLILVGALFMLTYLFGWDLFGVFIGINRSMIMDFTILLMMIIEQYMLLNKKMLKDLYGGCSVSFKRKVNTSPMEKTLSDELSNEESSLI